MTTDKIFYTEAIHAFGVKHLASASGAGRGSLCRNFLSKNELTMTMQLHYDRAYRTWLTKRTTALSATPLAAFDSLIEHAETSEFRGRAFINAIAEVA